MQMKQNNWGHIVIFVNTMITEESRWRSVRDIEVNYIPAVRLALMSCPVRNHDIKYYLTSNSLNHKLTNQFGQVTCLKEEN